MSKQKQNDKKPQTTRPHYVGIKQDIIAISVFTVTVFACAVSFDLSEIINRFFVQWEKYQFDEVFFTLTCLTFALLFFSVRRWRELRQEIENREKVTEQLHEARAHLERRVHERTADLNSTNNHLLDEINARTRTEQALRISEATWRSLVENTPDSVLVANPNLEIQFANRLPENTDTKSLVGESVLSVLAPQLRPTFEAKIQEVIKKGTIESFEHQGLYGEHPTYWHYTRIIPVTAKDNISLISIISTNITDRKRFEWELKQQRNRLEQQFQERTKTLRNLNQKLYDQINAHLETEAELKKSQEQLRIMGANLHMAREDDRAWISREIHDELGQLLASLKMDINWLENNMPAKAELFKKTKSMSELITLTTQSVRKITQNLRPSVLDNLGFYEAIDWHVQNFQQKSGIACTLDIRSRTEIKDKEMSNSLFRVVQETLTNVYRHAQATEVTITIQASKRHFYIKVKDNGIGFNKKQLNNLKSFGISGMRERIHFLEGTFVVKSSPSNGTSVSIRVPFTRKGKKKNVENSYSR